MQGFSQFLAMGGYGAFVWTSYGLSAAVLIWNVVSAVRRERQLLRELARAGAVSTGTRA